MPVLRRMRGKLRRCEASDNRHIGCQPARLENDFEIDGIRVGQRKKDTRS